jgi:hypothetical protein
MLNHDHVRVEPPLPPNNMPTQPHTRLVTLGNAPGFKGGRAARIMPLEGNSGKRRKKKKRPLPCFFKRLHPKAETEKYVNKRENTHREVRGRTGKRKEKFKHHKTQVGVENGVKHEAPQGKAGRCSTAEADAIVLLAQLALRTR